MGLYPGTRFGPYEVASQIGVGGMGEVYRATDIALGRQVAVKVLPDAVEQDPERLARFEREARTLAALNHPNIAHVYGLENIDGTKALVMELVEGPTLADRIAQGAMPVDEALPIAMQIAEALEAAHGQGIIHRDLKPANIKVRPDGTVKVLDFGLAKVFDQSLASSTSRLAPGLTQSPTITTPAMTHVGMILGTAAYMSPEQAKGREVDKRSDLWAFGVVLFEMLSGRRAFAGEDVTDTLANVLKTEPEWSQLPPGVPARVRRVIGACLEKDVKQRLSDAQDARLALNGAFDSAPEVAPTAASSSQPLWRRVIPVAMTAVLVGVLAWGLRPGVTPQPVNRFAYPIPANQALRVTGLASMALSPDGRSIVYNTNRGVFLRRMGELEARLIPGTEETLGQPFFSPDGQSIAYATGNRQLKRIPIIGGQAVVVCPLEGNESTYFLGAEWAADGTIWFGRPSGIMRVSASGGKAQLVIPAAKGESTYGPHPLPGGDFVVFSTTMASGRARWDQAQIVVQSLSSGERKVLVERGSEARYVPTGHLVYALDDGLFAVKFDAATLTVAGGPVSLLQGILRPGGASANALTGAANYGVSTDGTLAYLAGRTGTALSRLSWVTRTGQATPVTSRETSYRAPRLSPDGQRIAVDIEDSQRNRDIWVIDTARGTQNRLTSDPDLDSYPLWSPDGKRIVFASGRGGTANSLYWMAADGSTEPQALTTAASNQGPTSWSPDGLTLAFYEVGFGYDLFTLKAGERPVRLTNTPFQERGATFSPDGRWLAYSSSETGREEVYVTPFPGPGGRIAVSAEGGRSPRWSANGRELFFRNGSRVMAVAVEPTASLTLGSSQLLFEGNFQPEDNSTGAHNYDVSADGQRFLMLEPVSAAPGTDTQMQIVVVQNWFEELKRLAPTP